MLYRIIRKLFYSSYNLSIIKTIWINIFILKHLSLNVYVGKKTSVINKGGSLNIASNVYFDCKNSGQFFHDSHIILEPGSNIIIGKGVNFFSGAQLKSFENARIKIGRDTYFSGPIVIHSKMSIFIGECCSISWGVTIIDSDFHGINNSKIKSSPVNIGNNVWIGCNVTILKGVAIKSGCVIAAGSVLTRSTESVGVYAGNPARLIRLLDE
jgi:acetyltransferase-like isoleucine patch superfamily enzyme